MKKGHMQKSKGQSKRVICKSLKVHEKGSYAKVKGTIQKGCMQKSKGPWKRVICKSQRVNPKGSYAKV